jgi:hypothetical protein
MYLPGAARAAARPCRSCCWRWRPAAHMHLGRRTKCGRWDGGGGGLGGEKAGVACPSSDFVLGAIFYICRNDAGRQYIAAREGMASVSNIDPLVYRPGASPNLALLDLRQWQCRMANRRTSSNRGNLCSARSGCPLSAHPRHFCLVRRPASSAARWLTSASWVCWIPRALLR